MDTQHTEPKLEAAELESLVCEVLEHLEDEDVAQNLDPTTLYGVGEESTFW